MSDRFRIGQWHWVNNEKNFTRNIKNLMQIVEITENEIVFRNKHHEVRKNDE